MRFICMLNRTGSSWLCDILNGLSLDYRAGEWLNGANRWLPFDRETVDRAVHWRRLCRAASEEGRRAVVKCNIGQMRLFEEEVLGGPGEHHYVFLERKDLLGQAFSQFLLERRVSRRMPSIDSLDPPAVNELVARYRRANGVWREWLRAHTDRFLALTYEDLVADPEKEVRRVVERFDGFGLAARVPSGFDFAGARRRNSVPFLGRWREAMARYDAGDESWREPLRGEVRGELFLS